jgi:hypothetical protein
VRPAGRTKENADQHWSIGISGVAGAPTALRFVGVNRTPGSYWYCQKEKRPNSVGRFSFCSGGRLLSAVATFEKSFEFAL